MHVKREGDNISPQHDRALPTRLVRQASASVGSQLWAANTYACLAHEPGRQHTIVLLLQEDSKREGGAVGTEVGLEDTDPILHGLRKGRMLFKSKSMMLLF